MQWNKGNIRSWLLGAIVMLLLVMITGGINRSNENITEDTTISFRDIHTSADGRTVYVIDDDHVYRSTDGGSNWTVVLAKQSESY
jgi:photosystem II stability/assembly factor-like uncharacterized protein